MARWSTFANGSSIDCHESIGTYQGNGLCLNFEHVVKDYIGDARRDREVRGKCLFDQLLLIHLMEKNSRGIIRPVPVMFGDGQSLDLYNLFSYVKERGGYALVSEKRLWGSVAKDMGLNLQVLASLKLVYDRYLNEFEGWLGKICGGKSFITGINGCSWGFKSMPLELEKVFRSLLCQNPKLKDDVPVRLDSRKITKYIDLVNHKNEVDLLDQKCQPIVCENDDSIHGGNGIEDALANLDSEDTKKKHSSRKRKREELSAMLNWIRQTAKHPLDPSIGPIPEPSKWKECKGKDYWVQILRAKEAVLLKSQIQPNSGQPSWQV